MRRMLSLVVVIALLAVSPTLAAQKRLAFVQPDGRPITAASGASKSTVSPPAESRNFAEPHRQGIKTDQWGPICGRSGGRRAGVAPVGHGG